MNKKCVHCNLANFVDAKICIRCESPIVDVAQSTEAIGSTHPVRKTVLRRTVVCTVVCVALLLGFYFSLILSSRSLSSEERATVDQAIDLLENKGFTDEVRYLRRFATFRGSDNWLNSLVPKENAYAATNYPFEIMTVYPDFFTYTEDKVERAAILLHEAKHLQGEEEKAAYEFVWKNRGRLGWTKDKYRVSVLWKNVRKQTREYVPSLFICEFNASEDCTETSSLAGKF